MARRSDPLKRLFTYEQASALLSDVRRLTAAAIAELEALETEAAVVDSADDLHTRYEAVVAAWAAAVVDLGVEVKGLWLVDFDSGSGYYCWRYPEPALQFFHGYEEGFGGRVELN